MPRVTVGKIRTPGPSASNRPGKKSNKAASNHSEKDVQAYSKRSGKDVSTSSKKRKKDVSVSSKESKEDVSVAPLSNEKDVSASTKQRKNDVSVAPLSNEKDVSASTKQSKNDVSVDPLSNEKDVSASTKQRKKDVSVAPLSNEKDVSASSKQSKKFVSVAPLSNENDVSTTRPRSSSKVVKVQKQSNVKNKNMNPTIKIDMRDTFIKELVKVNGLPQDDYPSMRDIESVLILNKLPKRATENRNLYKFFGKGTSLRAPSKEVYLAMKRAVDTDTMKTTKNEIARVVAAAEREKIHEEVNKLIQEKDKRALEKKAAESVQESARESAKLTGMNKFVKVTRPGPPGPYFSHALKLHMASTYYDQILHYETDGTSEEDDDVRLEIRVEEEYGRLLLLPGLVRAYSLKLNNMHAPDLIRATQKLLISYLKLD